MTNPIASFFLGLICTGGLFALSLLLVVGGKMVILSFKEKYFPKPKEQESPPPPKATVVRRRKKPTSVAKPVRSIEIDPEQVDKIYVKKIS